MDIQAFVDAIGDAGRNTRKDYHLTLGNLIARLGEADPNLSVVCDNGNHPGEPISYRGYYSDLAFAPSVGDIQVSQFLDRCKAALGSTFMGYKGGDFVMGADTPLWLSPYGSSSGIAIVGSRIADNQFILTTHQTGE